MDYLKAMVIENLMKEIYGEHHDYSTPLDETTLSEQQAFALHKLRCLLAKK